ncbi:MAG: hypothetical protein IJ899_18680 [Blautia sp.]|nr:hypothetical protein [Blautia sp.]
MKKNKSYFEDWKEPLYACAMKHKNAGTIQGLWLAAMEFSFLGSYRDCEEMLRSSLGNLETGFEQLKTKALETDDFYTSVKANLELEQCKQAGMAGCAEIKAQAEKRKSILFEKIRKRQRRIRLALAGCLAAVILALTGASVHILKVVQPHTWEQAAGMEENREYEPALNLYRKLLIGPYGEAADEKISYLKEQIGYRMIEEGKFEEAVTHFTVLEDREGIRQARLAWGESLREEGKYEEALEMFEILGDNENKRKTYLDWSEALERDGAYHSALEVLRQMEAEYHEEPDKRDERLMAERCEAAIDAVINEETGTIDEQLAVVRGSELDDLDGLLKFCMELDKTGADLGRIFPEGVTVLDVCLDPYQPTADNQGITKDLFEDGKAKVLVFSREEKIENFNKYDLASIADLLHPKEKKTVGYRVWFLPGAWQRLPKERRAESLKECTMLLLSDTVYLRFDYVPVKDTEDSKLYYPMYEAADNICVYEKEKPDHFLLVDYQRNRPEVSEGLSMMQILLLDTGSFWGTSDKEYLKQALEKGISLFGG